MSIVVGFRGRPGSMGHIGLDQGLGLEDIIFGTVVSIIIIIILTEARSSTIHYSFDLIYSYSACHFD